MTMMMMMMMITLGVFDLHNYEIEMQNVKVVNSYDYFYQFILLFCFIVLSDTNFYHQYIIYMRVV